MSNNPVSLDVDRLAISEVRAAELTARARSYSEEGWVARKAQSKEKLEKKPEVSELTSGINKYNETVKIVRDERSGRSYVQIVDPETGEVKRQIPPEEVRRLSEILDQLDANMLDTVA